jgi:hypothetical protein
MKIFLSIILLICSFGVTFSWSQRVAYHKESSILDTIAAVYPRWEAKSDFETSRNFVKYKDIHEYIDKFNKKYSKNFVLYEPGTMLVDKKTMWLTNDMENFKSGELINNFVMGISSGREAYYYRLAMQEMPPLTWDFKDFIRYCNYYNSAFPDGNLAYRRHVAKRLFDINSVSESDKLKFKAEQERLSKESRARSVRELRASWESWGKILGQAIISDLSTCKACKGQGRIWDYECAHCIIGSYNECRQCNGKGRFD